MQTGPAEVNKLVENYLSFLMMYCRFFCLEFVLAHHIGLTVTVITITASENRVSLIYIYIEIVTPPKYRCSHPKRFADFQIFVEVKL